MSLSPSTRLGRYVISSMIGAGGMGEVFRAHDPKLQREVAVKILPANISEDPARLQRFEQEAHAASRLNHPNILSIYDVGVDDVLPLVGERKPIPFLQTQFSETQAQFSPDGRWVAYASDESGQPEVYVQSFQGSR